ncbi:MAG: tetratricopeptide repeat protein [Candidatus Peregrinibacteria bacterium]
MVYVFVLFGSIAVMCALFGGRLLLRHRAVRRFVRGIRLRMRRAEERGVFFAEEFCAERPRKLLRTSAVEMQQVRSLIRRAEKALAQNESAEAERLLIQALTVNPQAHEVRAQLAKLYLLMGREPKAEAMYRELLLHVDDVSFHANLALALYRQEKYTESCQSYQEALNRDPKNPERSAALGRACIAAQRFKEAVPLLEKAVARLTRDTVLLRLLAECHVQLGEIDRAEDVYRRINKMEPYDLSVKEKLTTLAHV